MDVSAVPQTNGEEPAKVIEPDRLTEPVGSEQPPRLPFPVVGMGASAGGLEAFIEFFDRMPSDSHMAFVLVQHLPPDRESMVADILAKHTRMPVQQVEDGVLVEPDHVYMIRPGHTLTIKDGKLHLGDALKTPGHMRPVDDFFRSLAEEQRERAICIIMSGMGSNGSAGAEAIKAVGGVAIAQDPESAKFPSMPRHLVESGNADFVRRPEEMPELLLRYAEHPYVTGRQSPEAAGKRDLNALGEILSVLKARTKRDFTGYKKPTVVRRIQRRMGLNQIETLPEYATFLRQTPAEVPALSDDLMIHVTGFFRDAEAWEALQTRVIEPLLAERSEQQDIRCWVTACSSGEEAYTLAMLLWEASEDAGKSYDIKVFATDMAERSLGKARAGIYPLGIEAEISAERLVRFFERDDSVYRVKKELREMVVFAPQNVIQDPPFSKLDICTCRNLLIYLEPELQRRVLTLLHFGLREGGTLFLGTSETIAGVEELFEPVDKRARIFRRVGHTRHDAVEFAFPHTALAAADAAPTRAGARATMAQLTQRILLERHTPPAVTVDREQRIVYFHGDTTPYLVQPPGEPTRDLMAMARENIRGAIRSALQHAVAENRPGVAKDGLIDTDQGRFRIEVHAEPIDSKLSPGHYYLVSFHHVKDAPRKETSDRLSDANAAELEGELQRVRDELQSTIEELQTTNEEMRASNEETMSINEELQSTNEELETSKEELQSLNEELTTVNVQLQTKMEEHEAASSDLSSLLSSTDIAVIFLDTRFRIRNYTPAVKDLVELIPSDVGRPLSDLHKKFDDASLLHDAQMVLNRLSPVEQEVASPTGRIYMRRVTPYRTLDNRIDGVVITFVDVTALKRAEELRSESEVRYRVITESARDFAIILMHADGRIEAWNTGAERILGWSEGEAVGKPGSLIYPDPDGQNVFAREMEAAVREGRAADETWHVRKGGERFWGSGVLSAFRAGGEITGFVKILRDETPRKLAEQERDRLLLTAQTGQRDAENINTVKDQFLARLSHEMRTPLSSILTWAEMLQHRELTDEQLHEGLRVIERSATAQKELLDDLLDTSRIASGKMRLSKTIVQPERLAQMAVEAMSLSAAERGVALELHAADSVGSILADPDRLRQVITNLIVNAVKFTPSGGRVDVRLERTDDHLELRVSDTGQGIAPEFLPHIFTPFSQADPTATRAYGGLGLGLAICRELVEMHGGTIRAESEGAGQGSTFIVRLPLPTQAQLEQTAVELEPIPHGNHDALRGVRILLIEDDHATQAAFARMLTGSGAEVATAGSADEALAAFTASPPDVILSDIGLPVEDGYGLLKRVRELEQERGMHSTPAIALTAFAGPQHRRRAKEAGFQAHIAKPAKLATLISTIARYAKK